MGFLIVSDPVDVDLVAKTTTWGRGTRLYYCGEGPQMPQLEFAIGSAVEFGTREAADLRLMILCVWEPDLVEHGHIVEREAAWAQWHADLKRFEKRSGLDNAPEDRGGCF
jgi:hypothetical protein